MSKSSTFKLKCIDGDTHFVCQDSDVEPSSNGKDYSEIEAIKASRKEAVKPLLLLREE
ncbi:MAG: hypothetical protein JSV51_01895 [Candidatus Bathyarchaeota archaeon]|nr:MAG: hypothetical protein JSV51_01895 [Candidatus Bathyarchaeota archaeon]